MQLSRILVFITSLTVVIFFLFTLTSPAILSADATTYTNLISNPNFSNSTNNQPNDWTTNSWGSNTASFSYLNSGYVGNHSVRVAVSNYISGDAKWMPNAVNVTSGSTYVYSDWYQASTITNIWAQFQDTTTGLVTYQWLGNDNPSSSWAHSQITVTIPSGVNEVSIFHVLNANGQLTIDNVTYNAVTSSCSVNLVSGIDNGNLDQICSGNPNLPAGWKPETYGSVSASYDYTNSGINGSNALATSITQNSGEAGWQTINQSARSNQRYQLQFWQNSTTYLYAYAKITLTNGSAQYISLMSVPATLDTGWSKYTDNILTPNNTQSIKFVIASSGIGNFAISNISLTSLVNQNPSTFNSGIVSVTFDDGDGSSFTNGLPILQSNGLHGTFYVNGSTLNTSGYMTYNDVKILANDGNEIGSHLYQHYNMVTISQSQLIYEINTNNSVLHNILGANYPLTDFASPYGSYTSSIVNVLMQYYDSHRVTDGQFNTKNNLNVRQIHAILISATTTPAQVDALINKTLTQNAWLVLVYHSIGSVPPGNDGAGYATTPSNFSSEMSYLHSTHIQVLTVHKALNLLLPQTQL